MGEPHVEDAGKDPDDPRPTALGYEHPPRSLASSAAVAGASANSAFAVRASITAARWRAKHIGRYAHVLDGEIPPEFEGVREIARKIAKKADAIVTWADGRLAEELAEELAKSGDKPRLQSEDTMPEDVGGASRAQIVALMRDTYEDPASFHEALARALNIREEEYAPQEPVFRMTMPQSVRDQLRDELRKIAGDRGPLLARDSLAASQYRERMTLVKEALAALDDAEEVE